MACDMNSCRAIAFISHSDHYDIIRGYKPLWGNFIFSDIHTEIQRLRSLQEYPTEPLFSRRLSVDQKIAVVLGYLRDARIAPVDIMLHVLDPQLPEHDRYRVAILANEPRKLTHVALMGLELFHCCYDIGVAAVSDFPQCE